MAGDPGQLGGLAGGEVVGSSRGAVSAFRPVRFPGPPSEPDVRLSPHPALHQARRNGARAAGSAVPSACERTPWIGGVHRRLLPCRSAVAAWLSPLAMWPAFPASDYYGDSATPWRHQPTTGLPAARGRRGRHHDASHVHHHPVGQVGAQLCPDSIATSTPQAFLVASSSAPNNRVRSRPPEGGVRCRPAHIHQVGAGGRLTGL